MSDAGSSEAWLIDAGERLCGEPVVALEPIQRGANNRVYRLETAAGEYALKIYPPDDHDRRDRLGAEIKALEFLAERNEPAVPKPVVADRGAGLALYEWIACDPVKSVGNKDIDGALCFAKRLKTLSGEPAAAGVGDASECCLSGREIADQVTRRIVRLEAVAGQHAELKQFLETAMKPAFRSTTAAAAKKYREAGLSFDTPIARQHQTLSPSDFGFHNSIRRKDGTLVFTDFEYFGWDDPVRLVADFVLHPGMSLAEDHRRRFADGADVLFSDDPVFRIRYGALYPLVVLRWCAILLNEFLPERWERRQRAGAAGDWGAVRDRQLEKARYMLRRMDNAEGDTVHGQ